MEKPWIIRNCKLNNCSFYWMIWTLNRWCSLFRYIHFKANLKRDIVLSVTGIVAAHPFHVISLRMMSQFIGKEKFYTSIVASIMEIYRNEGIRGFFSGIIPKLIGDLLCLIVASSTVYVVNKYIVHDKNGRQYSAGFIQVDRTTNFIYIFQISNIFDSSYSFSFCSSLFPIFYIH